jgi:hypothetical protein
MAKKNPFFEYQHQIIQNLRNLKANLENCEEFGLVDEDEFIYNEIIDLIDETKSTDTLIGLSEIITKAKVIETKLDSWFSNKGITSLELSWPQI